MTLVRFDPWHGYGGLRRKMRTMMHDFDTDIEEHQSRFAPRVDISEDDSKLYIYAELPGAKKDDFKVTVSEDNILTLKGSKKNEVKEESKDQSFIRVERSYGEFCREFSLPDYVNKDSITAKFENGLLSVLFDKIAPKKPNEKEIQVD